MNASQGGKAEHGEQRARPDARDRAWSDIGDQAGDERQQRHRGQRHAERHKQPVLQQRRQGEEVHPDDRAHPDRDEVALPGNGQDRRADSSQAELHPDGDTVAAPGLPVVQDTGGRGAAERLDPTGDGYQQYLDDSGDLPVLQGYDTPSSVSPILLEANKAFEEEGTPSFGTNFKHGGGYPDVGTDLSAMMLGKKTVEQVAEAVQKGRETAEKAANP